MPNQFVTPTWIAREFSKTYDTREFPAVGDTIRVKLPDRYIHDVSRPARQLPPEPLPLKAVLALGAAAVVASPRKISRRSLFGLGWRTRDV